MCDSGLILTVIHAAFLPLFSSEEMEAQRGSEGGGRARWQRETPARMGGPGLKDERKVSLVSLERNLFKNGEIIMPGV